ncbi:MAG: glycerophosphodiester phosphodiesterase [Oscillospiraceae bacterium]|nr:glycerophosphodiester phosphodiesterase [Oscillospiraceae bacterium]
MTENFAHRGFSAAYPENTMAAFQKAEEAGCGGIEMDLHLSADGVPVIIHDETLERTTGAAGWVGDTSFAQLRRLDASYRFAGKVQGNRIPALEEVLEWCRGTGLRLNLELKTNVREYPGIEQKAVELVARMGMEERVIFSSFNHYTLLRLKEIAPSIPCGALVESWIVGFGGYLQGLGLECAHPLYSYLTEENLADLKRRGLRVHTWTVNQPEQMRRLIRLGTDILITNHPDVLAGLLREEAAGNKASAQIR